MKTLFAIAISLGVAGAVQAQAQGEKISGTYMDAEHCLYKNFPTIKAQGLPIKITADDDGVVINLHNSSLKYVTKKTTIEYDPTFRTMEHGSYNADGAFAYAKSYGNGAPSYSKWPGSENNRQGGTSAGHVDQIAISPTDNGVSITTFLGIPGQPVCELVRQP